MCWFGPLGITEMDAHDGKGRGNWTDQGEPQSMMQIWGGGGTQSTQKLKSKNFLLEEMARF